MNTKVILFWSCALLCSVALTACTGEGDDVFLIQGAEGVRTFTHNVTGHLQKSIHGIESAKAAGDQQTLKQRADGLARYLNALSSSGARLPRQETSLGLAQEIRRIQGWPGLHDSTLAEAPVDFVEKEAKKRARCRPFWCGLWS